MKLSDAMEAGYAKVGKQCFFSAFKRTDGRYYNLLHEDLPLSEIEECCAMGAVAIQNCAGFNQSQADYIIRLNDECKMPIPEIVEVLRSMSL